MRGRGARARPHRPALEPHPVRGRGAVRPRDDHPLRAARSRPGRWPSCATSRGSTIEADLADGTHVASRSSRASCRPSLERLVHAGVTTSSAARRRSRSCSCGTTSERGISGLRTLSARAQARPGDDPGLGARARRRRRARRLLLRSLYATRPRAARSSTRSARRPPRWRSTGASTRTRSAASSPGAWAGIALALAGLMSILIVVRHTRAEEETGRAELVGAGVVGRHAPLAAALLDRGARQPRAGRDRRARASSPPASASAGALGARRRVRRRRPRLRGASPRSPRRSRSPRAGPTGSRSACSAPPSPCARSATPARTGWPGSPRSAGARRCARSRTSAGGCCSLLLALAARSTARRRRGSPPAATSARASSRRVPGPRAARWRRRCARLAPAARRAGRLGGRLRDRRRARSAASRRTSAT